MLGAGIQDTLPTVEVALLLTDALSRYACHACFGFIRLNVERLSTRARTRSVRLGSASYLVSLVNSLLRKARRCKRHHASLCTYSV